MEKSKKVGCEYKNFSWDICLISGRNFLKNFHHLEKYNFLNARQSRGKHEKSQSRKFC